MRRNNISFGARITGTRRCTSSVSGLIGRPVWTKVIGCLVWKKMGAFTGSGLALMMSMKSGFDAACDGAEVIITGPSAFRPLCGHKRTSRPLGFTAERPRSRERRGRRNPESISPHRLRHRATGAVAATADLHHRVRQGHSERLRHLQPVGPARRSRARLEAAIEAIQFEITVLSRKPAKLPYTSLGTLFKGRDEVSEPFDVRYFKDAQSLS